MNAVTRDTSFYQLLIEKEQQWKIFVVHDLFPSCPARWPFSPEYTSLMNHRIIE